MPEAAPTPPSADRNLLFGILALQMDFVTRDALLAAMGAWVLAKHKPLGQILVEQGGLAPEEHALVEAVVHRHVLNHGGDPQRSLAAVSSIRSARQELEQIADPDLQASLAHVAARPPGADLSSTTDYSAGTPTSSGLRFRVLRPHARGGLGEVFVARDEELHREVALKQIQAQRDDPPSRARFLLEAEVTGGLEHPGVVPVYGLGTHPDGRPFYAMRLVKGDSLKDAIRAFHAADGPGRDPGQRRLALRQLLGRFVAVCNAVAYAHSRGVLHRDLKPGNVMLGPYGETLVVDWGLAKVVGRPAGGDGASEGTLRPPSAEGSAPTQVGAAVGTPPYMSPEPAAGKIEELGVAGTALRLDVREVCGRLLVLRDCLPAGCDFLIAVAGLMVGLGFPPVGQELASTCIGLEEVLNDLLELPFMLSLLLVFWESKSRRVGGVFNPDPVAGQVAAWDRLKRGAGVPEPVCGEADFRRAHGHMVLLPQRLFNITGETVSLLHQATESTVRNLPVEPAHARLQEKPRHAHARKRLLPDGQYPCGELAAQRPADTGREPAREDEELVLPVEAFPLADQLAQVGDTQFLQPVGKRRDGRLVPVKDRPAQADNGGVQVVWHGHGRPSKN
jgi:hypothetical protein